ncbi:hypothetical protein G3T20_05420 [Bordetella hinzii]|uniref:hypothetical protein n=1 Tax=Bordetella hinzii TaxID=103855 RepID=UPI0013EFE8DE|nr:hypothetical protein [Bordetella hinzii]QII84190.1 hypothetical protein G3T20_05420 [Bordetella hinzii]
MSKEIKQRRERRVMQVVLVVVVAAILFSVIAAPDKWFSSGETTLVSLLLFAVLGWCAWHWFARNKT